MPPQITFTLKIKYAYNKFYLYDIHVTNLFFMCAFGQNNLIYAIGFMFCMFKGIFKEYFYAITTYLYAYNILNYLYSDGSKLKSFLPKNCAK
jgi:hypothetical protein